MSEKKVGIIGCGNIGKDVIKILKPFNCEILVCDIDPNIKYFKSKKNKNIKLDRIFSKVDIVTIMCLIINKIIILFLIKCLKKLKRKILY